MNIGIGRQPGVKLRGKKIIYALSAACLIICSNLLVLGHAAAVLNQNDSDSIYNDTVWYKMGAGTGSGAPDCFITGSGTLPTQVPEPYNTIFTAAANKFNVPPALLTAIFLVENNGKQGTDPSVYKWRDPPPPYGQGSPWSVSSAGAKGPFQFLDGTWKSEGQDGNGDGTADVLDLTDASFGAANYLNYLLGKSGGNIETAAGGYEAGSPTDSDYGRDAYALYQYYLGGSTTDNTTGGTSNGTTNDCSSGVNNISGYQNPLRDVQDLTAGLGIDAGVDYGGSGPVYALGNGTLNVVNPDSGWVGGNAVAYTLNSGPAAGKTVYVAENCIVNRGLSVGQQVDANTVLCTMQNAYPFMETGWAIPKTDTPVAYYTSGGANCYYFAQVPSNPIKTKTSTQYGSNFNDLMVKLGAPSAPTISPDITCTLPSGWPSW